MAAQVRQEINILDHLLVAATGATATSNEIVQYDESQYNGTQTAYFEVVAYSDASLAFDVTLVGATDGTVATINVPTLTTVPTLFRSASFNPTTATQNYTVVISAAVGTNKNVKSARIVIIQNATTLTNTETQIEIGNYNLARTAETATILTNPKYWKYDASKWDGTKTFYAEAVYDSGDMDTITISLREAPDIAAPVWTSVATIVSAATTTVPTRTRVAFTPTDGRWYTIFSLNGSMDNHDIYRAGVVVQQTPDLELSLAEFWNFESNSTGSKVGIIGTDTGTPTYSSGNGKVGNGVGLTTADSISLADSSRYDSTNNLSFSFWFKTTANPTNQAGVQRGYVSPPVAGTVVWDMYMPGATGKWIVTFFDSAGNNMVGLTTANAINDGNWHHICATFERSGTTNTGKLYIDNNLDDNQTLGQGALAATSTATISVGVRAGVTNFAGSIDLLGVWTRTLSATDVSNLYNSNSGMAYKFSSPAVLPSKLEPQYLLANTLFAAGTALQTFLIDWDSTEWDDGAGSITYTFQAEAANGSTSDVTLQEADGGGAVTNSTLTNIDNAQISAAMTMPTDQNLDTIANANAGDVAAARILVAYVFSAQAEVVHIPYTNPNLKGLLMIGVGK